ncbi:MAG: TonB-dependent receptor family protein [Flavobacteriales bacterium]|nr:TonB-dependent receptor family protein [Flavobacteriales bacterium]
MNFTIITNKIDLDKKVTPSFSFETGAKYSLVNNRSNIELLSRTGTNDFVLDSELSNEYDYQENIFAGYVNFKKKFKEKIAVQLGLRFENTVVDGLNKTTNYHLKRNYSNLFPSLAIDYSPSKKNSYQLAYSYRLNRPGYEQMIPGKIFSDQLSYSVGNPFLVPQYSHNINLESFHNRTVGNSIGYTHVDNSLYGYSYTLDSSQISVDTMINFAAKDMISYSFFIQKQIKNFYRGQFRAMGIYSSFSGEVNGYKIRSETFAFRFMMNNDFILPKDFKLQVSIDYMTPFLEGVQKYSSKGSINFMINKSWMKGQLNTGIGVYDLLYSDFGTVTSVLPGQVSDMLFRSDSRRLGINLKYYFGNMRFKRKVESKGDDNVDRIQKAG